MKQAKWWIVLGCALLLCVGAAVLLLGRGQRPYRELDAAQIASAQVQLLPPDRTLEISDVSQLAEYLRAVVIYERDDSYTEYSGQAVIFTLTMADGREMEIEAYNPFLILDGVGYRTKYAPCEALNRYANRLLAGEDAGAESEILTEPPKLDIIAGDTVWETRRSSYCWTRDYGNGETQTAIGDGAHPLNCQALLSPPLETEAQTVQLRFSARQQDAEIRVCCWSDAHWGDTAAESEAVTLEGDTMTLKPGGYLYRITASWDKKNGCGGEMEYVVYIQMEG